MASAKIILQNISEEGSHASHVVQLLAKRDMSKYLLVSAYVTRGGVRKLESELRRIGPRCVVYAGINNGGTTDGGLLALLELGVELYIVDGGNGPIFHPKVFMAFNDKVAQLILGSANITDGGLVSNVEVGTCLELDLSEPEDRELFSRVLAGMDFLAERNPKNVQRIQSTDQIKRLLTLKLVMDEKRPKVREGGVAAEINGGTNVPSLYVARLGKTESEYLVRRFSDMGCKVPIEGYHDYFNEILNDEAIVTTFNARGSAGYRNRQPIKQIRKVNYNALFQDDGTIAGEISLSLKSFPNNQKLFDRLKARKGEIQPHFDETVSFLQHPDRPSKDGKFIVVARTYPDNPTPQQQRDLKRWHIETMVKLRKIVGPMIEEMID